MNIISNEDLYQIHGGRKFKFHFNVLHVVFTTIGAAILGGPVGAGIAIGAAIAAQGTGNLHEMYVEHQANRGNG